MSPNAGFPEPRGSLPGLKDGRGMTKNLKGAHRAPGIPRGPVGPGTAPRTLHHV